MSTGDHHIVNARRNAEAAPAEGLREAAQRLVDVIFAEAQAEPFLLPLRGMRAANDLRAALADSRPEAAPAEGLRGQTWRCPSCEDTVSVEGMCQRCGIFGVRREAAPAEGLREYRFEMWDGDTLVITVDDEDPGDMGEPRSVEEDGTTYLAVRAIISATEAAPAEGLRQAVASFIETWDRVALVAVRDGWPAMPQDFGSIADAVGVLRAAIATEAAPAEERPTRADIAAMHEYDDIAREERAEAVPAEGPITDANGDELERGAPDYPGQFPE